MLNSVRARLTMWYAGVLALVLIAFAAGVYTLMERQTFARLDSELGAVLQVTALSLSHEIEEHEGQKLGEESFRLVLRTMHHTTFPGQGIAVYRGSELVALKPAYDGLTPPEQFTAGFFTRGAERVASSEVKVPYSGGVYRVVAVQRMAATLDELAVLRRTLMIAVPFTVLIAAIVGYLLARKSLHPVVAMSEKVDRISSTTLTARIETPNPKDELGRLASTFNGLLARLQASFERQRQFMADASHELRTPVSVARTAAQVTLEAHERTIDEYREALAIIEQQMTRLTRVVNDLFLLARADAGAAALHKRLFYLGETIRESVKAARVLASAKDVRVISGDFPEAPFEGDEDLIRQLTLVLLDNAVKYTPAGGLVRVNLVEAAAAYRISVEDTGPGVPREAQAKIFERFYRVDKARSRAQHGVSGGAGLGLSIGRWIAEAHGGMVTLASSSAQGSVFVAELPRTHSVGEPVDHRVHTQLHPQ